MRSLHTLSLVVLAVQLGAGISPMRALACSRMPCSVPGTFAVPEAAIVPANFAELTVTIAGEVPRAGSYAVKLWRADDPTHLLLSDQTREGQSFVTVPAALEEGESYIAEATPICAGDEQPSTASVSLHFTAGPASAPPTTLGRLALLRSGPTEVAIGGSPSCWTSRAAVAADLTLDTNQLPAGWRDLLTHYQLFVDGQPFDWVLTMGVDYFGPTDRARGFYYSQPGVFRVWTGCTEPAGTPFAGQGRNGAPPGTHMVWVRARVPTSVPSVIESEHLEVELSCAGFVSPEDAGTRAPRRTETVTDGGATSAPYATPDAGPPVVADGALDSPRLAATASADQSEAAEELGPTGCSLNARQSRAADAAREIPLGIVLMLVARARTRRRARRSS